MIPWTIRRWLGLPNPDEERTPVEPGPRPPNPAWHHELAMAVLENRDEDAPYLEYARWLRENNDPRGALIEGDQSALLAHTAHFLGPLAFEDGVEVTWERGFWKSLVIDREWDADAVPALVEQALRHPSGLVLDTLEVRADCIPRLTEVLADGEVLPVRQLVVDARGGPLGAWAAVWARLPHLKTLMMSGSDVSLGDIDLPALESLAVHVALAEHDQWAIARMHAPHLSQASVEPPLSGEPAARLSQRLDG